MNRSLIGFFVLGIALCLGAATFITTGSQAATNLTEWFEAGGKTAYAAGTVALDSGSWTLDDALIGNLPGDAKTGNYAARIRNTGKLTMNFNLSNAGTVSVSHAVYGSDSSSAWELWQSTNGGSAWTKVGATVTANSTALVTANFTVNSAAVVRFEIRKTAGGANRLNIDNIVVNSYAVAPTPTPTITPTPTVTPTPPPSGSGHLTMGNPSNAATNVNQPFNYLLDKPQYATSYNRDLGRPNWTSWHLDSSWIGSTDRQDDFRPDQALPSGWYRVAPSDYSGSGYDRGHMCPSGDRTNSVANNSATFLMTNMIPQAPTNNQQTWANLENYSRTLATSGNELYIVSGGYGTGGYIAGGRVSVPTHTWKVLMVLPNGTSDAARVSTSTRLIAVFIPNTNAVNADWKQYRVSVDYVESMTGYDFFSNVPASIQNQIEASVDAR